MAAATEAEWEQDYWLGEMILDDSRMARYDAELPRPNANKVGRVGGNPALSKSLERYTNCLGINREDARELVSLAAAINLLVEVHGYVAFEILFLANEKQKREHILKISRKSIERQTERFEKVKYGKAKSVAPVPGDEAPDTMTFSKFFSRIGRARGPVNQFKLFMKSKSRMSPDDKAFFSELLKSYRLELFEFRKQVRSVEKLPGILKKNDSKRKVTKPAKSVKRLKTQLSAGLGMLKKNNRDLPRSSYDLRPTLDQYERMNSEIDELIQMVERLL